MEEKKNESLITSSIQFVLSKLKIILCLLLVAVIAGAAVGAILAPKPGVGTTMQFTAKGVTLDKNLLTALKSDEFIERLLQGEDGLPKLPTGVEAVGDHADAIGYYNEWYIAAHERYNTLVTERSTLVSDSLTLRTNMNKASREYSDVQSELLSARENPNITADEIALLEKKRDDKRVAFETAEENYKKKTDQIETKDAELNALDSEIVIKKKLYDTSREKVLETWREDPTVVSNVKLLRKMLTFSYPDTTSTNRTIDVYIELKNDEKEITLANDAIQRLEKLLPEYVLKMAPSDNKETEASCTSLSKYNDLKDIYSTDWIVQALKYAAVAAVVAVIVILVVCVAWVAIKLSGVLNGISMSCKASETKDEEKIEFALEEDNDK